MAQSAKWPSLLMLMALATVSLGCGGQGDTPDLGQVSGQVTLDGEPLSGVTIFFQPEIGRSASATVDDDGHYELLYSSDSKGTKLGSNTVTFQYPTGESGPAIPNKYSSRSPMSARAKVEVERGKNTFDFELVSDEPGSGAQEPIID